MRHSSWILMGALALASACVGISGGCASSESKPPASTAGTAPVASASGAKKAGALIWANNCTRCHNTRSPSMYSDAEWDVVVHHMRVRGNLTGEEERTIAEFLKSAN